MMFSEKLDEVQDGQKQDGTARHDEEAAIEAVEKFLTENV